MKVVLRFLLVIQLLSLISFGVLNLKPRNNQAFLLKPGIDINQEISSETILKDSEPSMNTKIFKVTILLAEIVAFTFCVSAWIQLFYFSSKGPRTLFIAIFGQGIIILTNMWQTGVVPENYPAVTSQFIIILGIIFLVSSFLICCFTYYGLRTQLFNNNYRKT